MAAAVTAEPPLRPTQVRYGTSDCVNKRFFDSVTPTKPTGMPIMAAGRQASSSTNRNASASAVGALPIATIGVAYRRAASRIPAAERVKPVAFASAAVSGLLRSQDSVAPGRL